MTISLIGHGQVISKHEADSLLKVLQAAKADTERMSIYFKLAQYQIYKPGEYKADLDSAETYLDHAAALNARVGSVDTRGFQAHLASRLAHERGRDSIARTEAEKALHMLQRGKNKALLAQAYSELAACYPVWDPQQSPEKIRLADSAAELYGQAGDIENQANSLEYLADLYLMSFDDHGMKAFETLNRCLAAHRSIHNNRLTRVYLLYGEIYNEWGNYSRSANYKLMALQSDENSGDTSMSLCEINNSIGITLDYAKEGGMARNYYRRALQIAEKYNDGNAATSVIHNVANSFNKSGSPDSALAFLKALPKEFGEPTSDHHHFEIILCYFKTFIALEKYAEARVYYDRLTEMIKLNKAYKGYERYIYPAFIDYYIVTKQYAAAMAYLQKEKALAATEEPSIKKSSLYHQYRLDSALGQYRSAMISLKKYLALNDSLYNETSSRQIKQLDVEYETEKKEHEIEIGNKDIQLLQSQTRLQENQLKQAAFVRRISFGGIILLLAIVGLIFSRYRIKQRQKKEIDGKNAQLQALVHEKDNLIDTKEWLLKELHHRVKNNLQVMMSLQQFQARHLTNDEALSAVNDSSNRLYAMSLIHQKLYKSDAPAQINMRHYIGELARHLSEAFAQTKRVKVETDLRADIELDVTQAIPVGLILNEAITNVFKYAFTGRSNETGATPTPHLWIVLSRSRGEMIELVIRDNGRGYAIPQDKRQTGSQGFTLMEGLAGELDGTLTVVNDAGLTIILRFPPLKVRTTRESASVVESMLKA